MAKIKRFYLLIAALIYSTSYKISDANAGYFGEMTDAECYVADKLWTFMIDNYYNDGNGIQNYTREQAINNYCNNSEVSEVEVNGTKAWCNEVFEGAYLDFDDCLTSEDGITTFQECSYAAEWGCGTVKCDTGMGYDTDDEKCRECGDGTYQAFGSFYSSSLGDYLYGHFCAGCPVYTASDSTKKQPSSKSLATSQNDCYIPKSNSWAFSDTTGNGYVRFGDSSAARDCYYDGTLGS